MKSYFPAIVVAWLDLAVCLALIVSGIATRDWKPVAGGVVGALLIAWALRRLIRAKREADWKAAFEGVLRRDGWEGMDCPAYIDACWEGYGAEGVSPEEALQEEADAA
jgi:hypothetical protein